MKIYGPHISRDRALEMQRDAYTAMAGCVSAVENKQRYPEDIEMKLEEDRQRMKRVVSRITNLYGNCFYNVQTTVKRTPVSHFL